MPITRDKLDLASFRRARPYIRQEMAAVMFELEKKIKRKTPKDLGNLRGAIGWELRKGPTEDTYIIGVIEPIEYAERQHEVLHKNYTTPGTGPKFVEKPLRQFERLGLFLDAFRRGVRKAINQANR